MAKGKVVKKEELREVKYCPFKKITDIQYKKVSDTDETLIQTAELEFFGECVGELCMAFQNGQCKLIDRGGVNA